jgi:hypothetical protein
MADKKFDAVKDSGKRQEFNTGAVRDTQEGKGRFDLISTIALRRLAKHYANGVKKYPDRNWEIGIPLGRYVDSAMRHLVSVLEGSEDEDNASAVIWNMCAFIHTKELINAGILPKELNDLEEYWKTQKQYREYIAANEK